jgi:hypothetical protein
MSGKSPAADAENHRKGYGQTTEKGPLTLSVDDLPKYGLANTTQHGKTIHRVGMAVGRNGEHYEKGDLRPPCTQAEVPEQQAVDGKEYRQEWRSVVVARRLPFSSWTLCRDSDCFAGVEVEDL